MTRNLNAITKKKDGMLNYLSVMVGMMCSDHIILKRRHHPVFFDSTYDLFDEKAAEEAHRCAVELEKRAAELEVTVDYYIEEFDIDEYDV
jgi:hypothetical protein